MATEQIPIYVNQYVEEEATNHVGTARKKRILSSRLTEKLPQKKPVRIVSENFNCFFAVPEKNWKKNIAKDVKRQTGKKYSGMERMNPKTRTDISTVITIQAANWSLQGRKYIKANKKTSPCFVGEKDRRRRDQQQLDWR